MTAYERGYLVGQGLGFLLAAGLLFYFLYIRPRRKKKTQEHETLDEV